jgi:hypothetical protein
VDSQLDLSHELAWLNDLLRTNSQALPGRLCVAPVLESDRFVVHIEGMSQPTTVVFSCPKCGLVYQATQQHDPINRPGRFDCMHCRATVHSWTDVYDYVVWKPLKMKRAGRRKQ